MKGPTTVHVQMAKKIGRYLKFKPRVGIMYKWQEEQKHVDALGDTNHNDCKVTGKSTNGGAVKIGGHSLIAWSTTQATPGSWSSGETEWMGP